MHKTIVFDIGNPGLLENKLFDPIFANKVSHTILPLIYLYNEAKKVGFEGVTPDVYLANPDSYPNAVLFSHMRTEFTDRLIEAGVKPLIMTNQESPIIAYRFYFDLKKSLDGFSHAFLFSGFKNEAEKTEAEFHVMYFPEPYSPLTVVEAAFENRKLATMICGNKRVSFTMKRFLAGILSGKFYRELYKERLNVIKHFSANPGFDLYGIKWDKPIAGAEAEMRAHVEQCLRGPVDDKTEALRGYKFNFALENTICPGYLTEKIFDPMFAGAVPVYLGAPDIIDFVPKECFVDMRDFKSYAKLEEFLGNMSEEEYRKYIDAINRFIGSDKYALFTQESFAKEVLKILENE